MEIIEVNGNIWQKYKGDEGQDVYVAQFLIEEDKILGQYVDESSYDILVEGDADLYLPPERVIGEEFDPYKPEDISKISEERVAFKFRKNSFTEEEQAGAFEGLYGAAVESNNRGMAAGPREESQGNRDWVTPFQADVLDFYLKGQPSTIDGSDPIQDLIEKHKAEQQETRGGVWLRTKIEQEYDDYHDFFPKAMEKFASLSKDEAADYAKLLKEKWISATSYATAIWSGIAGFYGRYPRIPYGRATAFTDHHRETFEKCYPFARKLDKVFGDLLPERHAKQKAFADRMDKKFLIGEDTTFTTITVNTTSKDRNARMACHRDAGSLNEGFSNLTVITKDGKSWKGGYLVCPEVRAAINIRPGDLLLVDNMRIIHGNTPIEEPESGADDMLRMSLVFYFREDMDKLGSWEYESLRKQFVDDRRKDETHDLWRPYWNGVSPSMFSSQEWYDYLESNGGRQMAEFYHPEAFQEVSSLESFF